MVTVWILKVGDIVEVLPSAVEKSEWDEKRLSPGCVMELMLDGGLAYRACRGSGNRPGQKPLPSILAHLIEPDGGA